MSVPRGEDGGEWTVEELGISCVQMRDWFVGWVEEQKELRRDERKPVR